MKDSEKALEKDSNSVELKRIYESAEFDKKHLLVTHKQLSSESCRLLDAAENDVEFLNELKSTTEVNEDFQKAFESLKNKFLTQREPGCEA